MSNALPLKTTNRILIVLPDAADDKELLVFISNRESTCDECKSALGRHAWIRLVEDSKALCLSCADLDHLEFLASGNPCVTRRARKASILSAVVLKWSRSRKRYERQGLLIEAKAIAQAEESCLGDAESRAIAAERRHVRDAEADKDYIGRFAEAIRTRYPDCPQGREMEIAEHACRKYSGRVGRSASAKQLDDESLDYAVRAHVRHAESSYDKLLSQGLERFEARAAVGAQVESVLTRWRGRKP